MKAEILIRRLRSEGYLFNYIGAPEEEIYGVTPWTVEGKGDGLLQICIGSCDLSSQAAGILVLTHAYDASIILSLLQGWLVEGIRRQEILETLRHSIAQNYSLYEVTRLCSLALHLPAVLLDQELNILVQYPVGTLTESGKKHLMNQVLNWRYETSIAIQHPDFDDCDIRMLVYDEKCYYLVAMTENDPLQHVQCKEILDQICSYFDAGSQRSGVDSMEMIIRALLLRRFTLTEHDRARMRKLGWIDREKYYVLLIDNPLEPVDSNFVQTVQNYLGSPVYPIGHQYVAILWSDKYLELTEKHYPELSRYLISCKSLASLSFGFFNLVDAPTYFEQCCRCTEMAIKQGYKSGLWGVSRFQLSVLIRLLPADNTVDLRQFCHPTILLLYDIDREQDTSYLDTLFTYIVSGRSVKRTAAAMNLHVNTVYTRVTKLQDRFNIDFNDDHLLYCLHNSINLINLFYDPDTLTAGFPFLG